MTKETIDKKTKTMLVERNRVHYARSYGDPERVRVEEPLAIELDLPTSYARDLRHALQRVLDAGGEFDQAMIAVDLPVRIWLQPLQVEQLVAKLAEIVP